MSLALLAGAVGTGARAAGVRSAADCVPAETLLFLSLPDPNRTAAAWRATDLFRLWSEPDVQAFLERPLSQLPANPVVTETLNRLGQLEVRDAFFALTRFEESPHTPPRLLAGFQFRTDRRAELDALLAAPKEKLRAAFPGGRAETADHRGRPVEIFRTGQGDDLLASATRETDGWYLVSNDLDLLKAALDRLDAAPAATSALGSEADFRAVRARMPASVETFVFARPQPLVERGLRLAGQNGVESLRPEQREPLQRTRALGATTAFDPNGKIRDTLFALDAPGLGDAANRPAALAFPTLPLAPAGDSVFYGSARLLAPGNTASLEKFLTDRGLTLAEFQAAFAPEAGAWAEWPATGDAGAPSASLSLALPVRERAAAAQLLEKLLAVPTAPDTRWEKLPDTPDVQVLRGPNLQTLAPTLALGERHLFFGLQPESVQRALGREKAPPAAASPPLAATEAFRAARSLVGPPDLAFAFLDTRALFERAYAAARPMVAVGALMFPQSTQYVDVDRLPTAEIVARHLSPVALSQRRVEDGVILESAGPLTFPQLAGLLAGASALGMNAKGRHDAPPAAQKTPAPAAKSTGP